MAHPSLPRKFRTSRAAAWLLASATLLHVSACRSRPASSEEVWAEVNGQPIFRSQVERYYERETRPLPKPLTLAEAQARRLSILSELIRTEILRQEAVKAGLQASDAEVEARFQKVRGSMSEAEFQQQMAAQAMTLKELRAELRREVVVSKLLDQKVAAVVRVSDQAVADYYQSHKNGFRLIEAQYHIAHILVTPRREREVRNLQNDDATSDAAARRKVQAVLERVRAGDDFAELARSYSEDPLTALSGGDLGFFPETDLSSSHPALRSLVQRLQAGQVGGPVRTPAGYHLVKVLEREPPGERELSDPKVQQVIRERLRRYQRQLLEAAYLEQARNRARVVNHLAGQILESSRISP
ncbi:MAG: peptidylprolyl isomerase [Terriglobia bacterium]